MAIHSEHSSFARGALNRHRPETLDFDLPPGLLARFQPAPAVQPEAPAPLVTEHAAEPAAVSEGAPHAWLHDLPTAPFGPPASAHGEAPGENALSDLPPPAVVTVTAPAVVVAPAAPTASPMEIATLELTLADPLNRELVQVHGGALPAWASGPTGPLGPVLQAQVERYGPDLAARLTQLAQANDAVRHQYLAAMDAAARGLGPGTMGAVFVPADWGGGRGNQTPATWRFDPVVFTQAYALAGQQAGAPLAQRAFAALHGPDALQVWNQYQGGDAESTQRSHLLAGQIELVAPEFTDLDHHPNRERMGWTAARLNMGTSDLRPLSLGAPPNLHNPQAVWFDAQLGWVTPAENIVVKADFLDKAIPMVFVGVMTWATAGAFGIAGGAGVASGAGIGAGGTLAGAMTAGAAFGAIGGFYGGIVGEGRIDLQGIFRGALTGAVTAGVTQAAGLNNLGLNRAGEVTSYAQRALAVTGQATLQGALQELSGGNFREGFTAGLAQGLGAEIARGLNAKIDQLASGSNSIDVTQAGALRQFARVARSAVSLLGNPNDPGHAFAMTFVNGLVSDVQAGLTARETQSISPAWAGAPDETAAETARLARSGVSDGVLQPPVASMAADAVHAEHDQALARVNARWGMGTETAPAQPETADPVADGRTADQRIEIVGKRAPYAEQVAYAVSDELGDLLTRGLQAAAGALDALEITPLANVKAEMQAYLDARAERGLSQAEMIVLGTLYAVIETAFPTNALDFAGAAGKGVAAVGAVVLRKGSLDEAVTLARVEAQQARLLNEWTQREARYVNADGTWVRRPDGTQDAAAQLAASLERTGQSAPDGWAPHHVVGFGVADRDSQEAFARFGLTPNDSANGVWLSRDVHSETFGNAYKRWVGEKLQEATSASQLRTILQDIARTIEGGSTPWKP